MQWLDFVIMMAVACFLMFLLAFGAKLHPAMGDHSFFFDLNNTKAMRGFWCLIVVLVHIPAAYQNRIQDLIGSFAYIGVTFFFMTSAFGLSEGCKRNPDAMRRFWRRRLPRLIVPSILINIIFGILNWVFFAGSFGAGDVFRINAWVRWLILCNLVFWLAHRFFRKSCVRDGIICGTIAAISLGSYLLHAVAGKNFSSWDPEIMGFIWGILLSRFYVKMRDAGSRNWVLKCAAACLLAMVLGVAYLKFKPVMFWGGYVLKVCLGIAILGLILMLNTRVALGNKIALFLGEISFEVYLIHGGIFNLLKHIAPQLSSGVYIIVCLALVVASSVLVHQLSRKVLDAIRRIPGFQ